jgi:hypothetical protein
LSVPDLFWGKYANLSIIETESGPQKNMTAIGFRFKIKPLSLESIKKFEYTGN